ncbi:Vegetative incompatibility protein HET-E-1 [Podospora anserina] [Rhizoctonia solani]|uniref:Vegetative incompatibility protein HET-E-1 [Podospora anserina] n=1 Tax=Rhizoctonia solani TaxID=456999 RepID=A0A0K6G9K4_9AGAM|nr:Vegetative incompatibility protein HET-E-1 [Podospora anserina] [Rhizoctonia solani]
MSSTPGTPKQKKGFQRLFQNPFSRFSSHLSAPSTTSLPQAPRDPSLSGSSKVPGGSGDIDAVPNLSSAPVASHLASAPATLKAESITNEVWIGLRSSLQGLGGASGLFPHLASAAGILLECFNGIESAARNQQDYEHLAKELTTTTESLAEIIKAPTPPSLTKCITGITLDIKSQAEGIKQKSTGGTIGRMVVAKEDEEDVIRHYRRIQSCFRQLQMNLNASTWSIANEHLVNTRLEALNPVKLATYDLKLSSTVSRRSCTEGTRIEILSNLKNWIYDSDAPSIYWMNGMAGTGKTTIACTFSEVLERGKRLAASFFCTRTTAECRDLCELLGDEPDLGSKNIQKQFERLLHDPLSSASVKDAMPGNLVITIDALDECEDRNGVEMILDMLFRHGVNLPVKFFVTSRPEPEIYERMKQNANSRAILHLHDIEASLVQADIELYLKEELESISPSAPHIKQLAERSGCLFIYAATLVRYIKFGKRFANPRLRLESILGLTTESTKKHAEIDALYTAILASALEETRMEQQEAEVVKLVLRTVLFAQEPINVETIAALAGLKDAEQVGFALQPLRSVLHQSEDTGLVSTLHASFPDFMFSNERSGEYFCDILEHSQALAERCFVVMKEQLRFNICDLESSFVPDEKVENLQERMKQKISATLAYACRYWGIHLSLASSSDNLSVMLEDFVSHRLLFWMEVLNLRREMAMGLEAFFKVNQWLIQASATSSDLVILVEDARNFANSFSNSLASQSTPHIYISSLPFCPRSSAVYKRYWDRTRGLLELRGSLMERRESAALAIWDVGDGDSAHLLAYSPDGTRIAAGCDNGLRMLNAHDGTLLFDPMKHRDHFIYSVAFSPDGNLVASMYVDAVKVWNAHTGALVSDPFCGPPPDASSRFVSFSPDGKRVVFPSHDKTICIRNISDGTLLHSPLQYGPHFSPVTFSPDGALIAYGSYDGTVQLCNIHDGTFLASLALAHRDCYSIAFTPDGTRLISVSDDIRVWTISDGSLAPHRCDFHSKIDMKAATVSPDGTRVASAGSAPDYTVQVWNTDGSPVAGPFVGHSYIISSVAFSPDGTRVISNAYDGTIRVWNVRDGLLLAPVPFEAHMSKLKSLFLFSGDRILSGSADSSTWVWNITATGIVSSPWNHESTFFPPHGLLSSSYILVPATDSSIAVLDLSDDSVLAGPLEGYTDPDILYGFSADKSHLATISKDRTVRVWDLKKGWLLGVPFRCHRDTLACIVVLTDGSHVVSCCTEDHTIRVWNTQPTMPLAPSPSVSPPESSSDKNAVPLTYDWKLQDDGWVTNTDSALLFWVPPDLASIGAWPSPHAEYIISKSGILQIMPKELLIGDRWSECYVYGQD